MTATEDPRIEWVPLDQIKDADRNPKDHDLDGVIASLRRFGYVEPMVMNESSGQLVAGHGRTEALRLMHRVGEPPPDRVHLMEKGKWSIPVLRGVSFKSDQEAEAYLVGSNRLVERGGWIDDLLAESLRNLNTSELLDGIGFSSAEATDIIAEVDRRKESVEEIVPDDAQLPRFDDGTRMKFKCPHCGETFNKRQSGGKREFPTRVGDGDLETDPEN